LEFNPDNSKIQYPKSKISESSVISLARRIKHFDAARVIKGIGDDCAVIRTPGAGAMLLTTDVFIEGVHFLPDQPPESVGGKLLAVNLSDIAAMGGRPGEALISMMLPETTSMEWVERFYAGLERVAEQYGVNVVGGDVSRHPDRKSLSLTLTGRIRRDEILFRKGGRPGDFLYVSGTLGDSDAGLDLLRNSSPIQNPKSKIQNLLDRYLTPTPRIELGRLLARTRTATACIDLSDGVSVGARQLGEASGVALEMLGEALPVSDELKGFCVEKGIDPVDWILQAGGDYELLFTVPPVSERQVKRFGIRRPGLPKVSCIGKLVTGKPGEVLVKRNGEKTLLEGGGWEHFAG
jgi:thiamine-monophosphate kinase